MLQRIGCCTSSFPSNPETHVLSTLSQRPQRCRVVSSPALAAAGQTGGRPRSVDLRRILNGIFYLLRTGCAWRYLPTTYGPWSTVYAYFWRWRRDCTWTQIQTMQRECVRTQAGRETSRGSRHYRQSSSQNHRAGLPAWLRWRQEDQWPQAAPPGRYLRVASPSGRASR
jgi:transposase